MLRHLSAPSGVESSLHIPARAPQVSGDDVRARLQAAVEDAHIQVAAAQGGRAAVSAEEETLADGTLTGAYRVELVGHALRECLAHYPYGTTYSLGGRQEPQARAQAVAHARRLNARLHALAQAAAGETDALLAVA